MGIKSHHPFDQRITTIGGGTGQFGILRGFVRKNTPEKITAVATTWDSGGRSGQQRTELGILPPGDYMQCILALMEDEEQQREAVFLLRDRSNGYPLVNELASKSERLHHGIQEGIDGIRWLFRVRGRVFPVCDMDLTLTAETVNGGVLSGEHEIDALKHDGSFSTKDALYRIYFDSPAQVSPHVKDAIIKSDKIVFSAGSPWTSIYPHLLINGLVTEIQESKAGLIVVLNLMTTQGEDHHLKKASEWLRAFQYYANDQEWIKQHGKSRINYMIANENHMGTESLKIYAKSGQFPVEIDAKECQLLAPGMDVITHPLASYDKQSHLLRHDSDKLAELILSL